MTYKPRQAYDSFITKDHGIYRDLVLYALDQVCHCRWCIGVHHPIRPGEVRFGRRAEIVMDELDPEGTENLKRIYKTDLQVSEEGDYKVVSKIPIILKDHQQYSKLVDALLYRVINFYQMEYLIGFCQMEYPFEFSGSYRKEWQELEALLCEVEPDAIQKIKEYFAEAEVRL